MTKPDREAAGFWDAALCEEVKKKSDEAIKRWIRNQLKGTSVTVVLVGTKTSGRKYIQLAPIPVHTDRDNTAMLHKIQEIF